NTTTAARGGGLNNTGKARLQNTLVIDNIANGDASGGGIGNSGELTISFSVLRSNRAPAALGDGGGLVTQAGATTNIFRSTLDQNTTGGSGGGIYNLGRTTLFRSLVELNTAAAAAHGGGIFNTAPGVSTLNTSLIVKNTPENCFPINSIPGCTN